LLIFINGKQCAAAPDPRSGSFLTTGSRFGMGKNPDPGYRMNIPDYFPRCLQTVFCIKTKIL
jgi:hypothetical protein